MVDQEVVSRKLSRLVSYVQELRKAEDITWEKYCAEIRLRAFVERCIHLAIEEVIDIANHFISFYRWREPDGYRDLFSVLHEQGVIPARHLDRFKKMASFRNMLVHHYEKIDNELVYGLFKKRLSDFDLFAELISDWLKKHAESDVR